MLASANAAKQEMKNKTVQKMKVDSSMLASTNAIKQKK